MLTIPNGCLSAQPDQMAHLVSNPRNIKDIKDYETEVVLQAFTLHEETQEIIVRTEMRHTGDILGINTPLRECRQGGQALQTCYPVIASTLGLDTILISNILEKDKQVIHKLG